jgi:AhpD family alkylhydroperoxidase
MAESPALIESFTTLRRTLGRTSFSPVERETISLVVSFENDCTYSMAAHATFAKMSGISEAALEALRVGRNPADARLGALATYTRHVVTTRGYAAGEATQTFLDAGFTPAQALAVIAVIAFTTIANYAHNLTGCALDPPFQLQVWNSPRANKRSA